MAYVKKTDRAVARPPRAAPLIVSVQTTSQMLGGIGTAKVRKLIRDGVIDGCWVGQSLFARTESVIAFAEVGEAPASVRRAAPPKPGPGRPRKGRNTESTMREVQHAAGPEGGRGSLDLK